MPAVLTEASTVKCAHQGLVSVQASQSKVTVEGAAVLVVGDLMGKAISGCATITNPATPALQCATVATEVPGMAARFTIGGVPVLLETVAGTTSGTISGVVQAWFVANAGQGKLVVV